MNESNGSGNNPARLIFTCSGIADVGEIADRTGRKLHKEGAGKMWCLAGIGAGLSNFIDATKATDTVLVIDGCPIDCGKKMMEKAGIENFSHINVTGCGFEKGRSPVTDDAIATMCVKSRELLAC